MKSLLQAAYRLLLRLYPAAFRSRFESEMLDVVEQARGSEWVLILSDTVFSVIKRRLWPAPSCQLEVAPATHAYLALNRTVVTPLRFAQGLAATIAILILFTFVTSIRLSAVVTHSQCRPVCLKCEAK